MKSLINEPPTGAPKVNRVSHDEMNDAKCRKIVIYLKIFSPDDKKELRCRHSIRGRKKNETGSAEPIVAWRQFRALRTWVADHCYLHVLFPCYLLVRSSLRFFRFLWFLVYLWSFSLSQYRFLGSNELSNIASYHLLIIDPLIHWTFVHWTT